MRKTNKQKVDACAGRARHPMRIRRANVCVLAAGVALVVAGMLLMLPPRDVKSEPGGRYLPIPTEGVFAVRRIRVAPLVALAGFVLVPFCLVPGWGAEDDQQRPRRGKNGG